MEPPVQGRWTFSCGGCPGINLAKALNDQTHDLDGANDIILPATERSGSKMRYCMKASFPALADPCSFYQRADLDHGAP